MKSTLTKVVLFLFFLGLIVPNQILAQQYPAVPAQIPFGGINVKFDQSARNIIASDIKVLMINQKYWEEKLERALLYFPIIESIFIDEEIPMDFKYLAAQESSLIPDAVSASNAVGFWQFKEDTARELGLRVDRHVDERKNISSSTRAAAKYLKRSNQEFNNWVSSLYSYYQGINGAKQKLPPSWNNAHDISLTGRTDRYVLRFFAYKIAFEAGLDHYRSKNPITLIEASAGKGRSLEEISAELKVSSSDLKNYNIWLRGNSIPTDKAYYITVPVASSKVATVKESLAIVESDNTLASSYEYEDLGYPKLRKLENQPSGYNAHVRYEINGLRGIMARAGDYPNTLARAGGISVAKFRKFNDMDVNDPVVPGEVYYLVAKNKRAATKFHTVRPGETLQQISQIYGIRLKNLMNYNRILSKSYFLEPGRELWLTQKRPANVKVKINDVPPPPPPREPTTQPQQPEVVAEAPTSQPTATSREATEPVREVAVSTDQPASNIPTKPSERVKYTPKIADQPETARTTTTAPTTSPAVEKETPAPQPKQSEAVAETNTQPAETVIERPNNRIVIVTEDDERPKPYISRRGRSATAPRETAPTREPATPIKEDVKPVYSPSPSANATQPEETVAVNTQPSEAVEATTAAEYYTVVRGDTYYSVSRRYGLTVTELLELNQLKISDKLLVGKKLLVKPGSTTTSAAPAKTATAPAKPQNVVHTVRRGETLSSISRRYGVTVQQLIQHNSLKGSGIMAGQKLKIPTK
ncbi:MAG: LysM peptidoglycan-binding domain-containing protein [Spirosomataceae bacterium]